MVVQHLRNTRWGWFAASITVATLSFPVRTIRWRYLLRIEGEALPFGPLWHATAIGFMANNVLPARAGEFVRPFAVHRLTGTRFTTAFASIAVERILDGMTLVALLVVAMLAADFDPGTSVGGVTVQRLAIGTGLLFGGLFVVAAIVVRWPDLMLTLAHRALRTLLPRRWTDGVTGVLEGMIHGLDALVKTVTNV